MRRRSEADLFFLLLLQMSEDGLGQEVRVVLMLVYKEKKTET